MGCRSVNDVRRSVEEGQLKLNSEAWKNSPWKNDSSEVEAVYNRNSCESEAAFAFEYQITCF